ncbi:MAG TPA: carbohydrate ABC transporter permease [Herpetosiphonaceae bacterium]
MAFPSAARPQRRSRSRPPTAWGTMLLLYILLVLVLLITVGPFVVMISTSLKAQWENFVYPPTLLPQQVTPQNYVEAWTESIVPRGVFNSFIVATVSVVTNVLFGSLAAFAFARMDFPGRQALFWIVLATMMMPSAVLVVPLMFIVKNMPGGGAQGWFNTYQGLIVPGAITAFSVFFMRQYFLGIPRDLDEAATIDGASPWQVFRHVALPLARPGLAIVAIFTFLSRWNEYLWPLIVARQPSMYTAQIALRSFVLTYTVEWQKFMAAGVMIALPVLLLYLILQPYFEQSLGALGRGVKG